MRVDESKIVYGIVNSKDVVFIDSFQNTEDFCKATHLQQVAASSWEECSKETGVSCKPFKITLREPNETEPRPGTVPARFHYLLTELSNRFPGATDPFSSRPPELGLLETLDKALKKLKEYEEQEPIAWMREWEGDDSDLGHPIFETNENELDDNPNWIALVPQVKDL